MFQRRASVPGWVLGGKYVDAFSLQEVPLDPRFLCLQVPENKMSRHSHMEVICAGFFKFPQVVVRQRLYATCKLCFVCLSGAQLVVTDNSVA